MDFLGSSAYSVMNDSVKSSGKNPLKIAVVQQNGNHGQADANRKKALSFAEQALQQHADVILFHEELLIGYDKNMKDLAEPVNGTTTQAFQKLLKGTGSVIIYGLTEKDGKDYFISAPVVTEDGVIANYHKTHLWWNAEGLRHEPTFYKPGNELVTFNVKGNLCGIMICYDGDFPEMTRSYANMGCTILFWMNNRGSRGHSEVKGLATNNSIIMPVSCCCGVDEEGNQCKGGSNITGPKGELIAELWDKEGFIVSDVYPDQVEKIRKDNPLFNGLRPEIYFYK
jgi:(R)-amidase